MIGSKLMLLLMQADADTAQVVLPKYFVPVFFVLMVAGLLGCLIAAVLGFGRARAHGGKGRWFALAAVCLIIYHVQLLVMGFAALKANASLAFPLITSLNLFIFLASVCIIFGFYKMKSVSPEVEVVDPD